MQPLTTPSCRSFATATDRSICVYPGVYQSASGILQTQHSCGLQPAFGEQVQNIE